MLDELPLLAGSAIEPVLSRMRASSRVVLGIRKATFDAVTVPTEGVLVEPLLATLPPSKTGARSGREPDADSLMV